MSMKQMGLELGHQMAEVAGNNAGGDWKQLAFEAMRQHALRKKYFTTEEVRRENPDFPEPPDRRAWGCVALLAKKEGLIQSDSWVRAESLSVHGMVVTRWASRIYQGAEE